jgi:NAD(P)-dependent dehydrogenase (short-subunit alcohol dehydrogenase family)
VGCPEVVVSQVSKVVLVTGCSSGIGKATAIRLAKAGKKVVATARKVEALQDCVAAGCAVVSLDVNDEASMTAAVAQIEREHGVVGALVNNAGYSQSGAVESLPMDKLRRQFETNVFGLVRMVQLCAPGMCAQGYGRIVNIGSMGGRFTLPGGGAYHATKWAVESLTDALRFELAGFGVDVVLIQPGIIRTGFAEAVSQQMAPPSATPGPYDAFNGTVEKVTLEAYEKGPLGRYAGGDPGDVARVVETALDADRPRTRYLVTPSAHVMVTLRGWMSDRMWDRFLAGTYPAPGRA